MVARDSTLRERHRQVIARGKPCCWLCGQPIDYSIPSTWRNSNTNEVFYTGDLRNPQYPELVYPGYQEFEEP